MSKKSFSWPDIPCEKCLFEKQWDIKRVINKAKHETFQFVCGHCGFRLGRFVSKSAVAALGLDIDEIEPIEPRHICEVCKSEGAESHHWAPYHLFGDEADRWPQSFLCKACHDRWHALVTPNASGTRKA